MSSEHAKTGLRIVAFHNLQPAYRIAAAWAERMGHTLSLVVTTPGPATRRTAIYRQILATAPPEQDILVTTRLRRVALPLIEALAPDLILSFTFPYRLPPEILAIPRIAAVNLHPTPLPRYRGPNPMRMIYDGAPMLGATLHYLDNDFDTGAILSQAEGPMPETLSTETVFAVWGPLMMRVLSEGMERAIAGDPGQPQDNTRATYSPEFSEEECWLDWRLPAATLYQRAAGLNIVGAVKGMIGGQAYRIQRLEPLADAALTTPGTLVDRAGEELIIAVADGAVRVNATPLTD
jgi:methionyl-tRNA formyltransferase